MLIKAHPSHPLTSLRSFEAIADALRSAGAPEGAAALVFGQDAGAALVAHPLVGAVSFTGALTTGRVLQDLISRREDPIPFYGELSSLNPLVVTPGAARARTGEIAQGLFTSVTGSGGQLCTKPGIAFVPSGEEGDRIVEELRALTEQGEGQVLLNARIREAYDAIAERLVNGGAPVAARGPETATDGFVVPPTLLTTRAADMTEALAEECFGPLVIVARYDDVKEVAAAVEQMPASLTATVHAEDDESALVTELSRILEPYAGRLVFNGYPTGVRVSWAQHHGGPWPSTNSQHTSVGVTAIRRFLRPFVWQSAPEAVLPEELREDYRAIPRRVDGTLVLAEEVR